MKKEYDFISGEMLLVDKPIGWTSFDVVKFLKFRLRQIAKIKVGHAGTLDPLATGLLIICTGKATKQIEQFQNLGKTYTGTFKLGATTPCYDKEMPPDCFYPTNHISKDLIKQTTQQFIGVVHQQVPIYSAIKQNGVKLYQLARKGQEIVAKSRDITISQFDITKIEGNNLQFEVSCSKGTYIRSLAHDFGKALNSGAHLAALRRTKIGNFSVKDAWQLTKLEKFIEQQTKN